MGLDINLKENNMIKISEQLRKYFVTISILLNIMAFLIARLKSLVELKGAKALIMFKPLSFSMAAAFVIALTKSVFELIRAKYLAIS